MTNMDRVYQDANGARLPFPIDRDRLANGASMHLVGNEGDWDPQELDAYTAPMEVVPVDNRRGVDVTVAPDPDSTQPEIPAFRLRGADMPRPRRVRREIRNGQVVETPLWDIEQPSQQNTDNRPGFWNAAKYAALGALATTITLVGVGGYILFSKTGVNTPSQPGKITLVGKSSPAPTNTAAATATPGKTPTAPSPTATPNTQPPTQTPPTPTPQPPTPTPNTGPQPEYVTKSDGNLQAGDTVFATCKSGSGAGETYTVNGQQYSSSDFQNTNDAKLPQC